MNIARTEGIEKRRQRRRLRGVVVSGKMKDTVVVEVTRYVKHPLYKKYLRRTKRYKVHDPGNTKKVGDQVTIEHCRPISKEKHFIVLTTPQVNGGV